MNIEDQDIQIFVPGDLITDESGIMSGQNTYAENGVIRSSVIGTVERTNKLIMMSPLRSAYYPQIGDIVVGRILEIRDKRWKVHIKSSCESTLHLNSTFIPQQRQKTEEDELNMRQMFQENDLICAEVHSINNDKTVNLHTRNVKYGKVFHLTKEKLENGLLVVVNHIHIKRQKHHFVRLKCGTDVIFSHNGMIWLNNQDRANREIKQYDQNQQYNVHQRQQIAKIANLIKLLNKESIEISIELLDELSDLLNKNQIQPIDICDSNQIKPILDLLNQKQKQNQENKLKKFGKHFTVLEEQ